MTMFLDFTEEHLPLKRHVLKLSRHKVPGGWYVRVIFTDMGYGAGARNEAAVFLSDPEHSWQVNDFGWEKLQIEPTGGIYRAKAPGGWLLLSTARGGAKTDDGTKYHPRLGSLVFIPDANQEWKCEVLKEKS